MARPAGYRHKESTKQKIKAALTNRKLTELHKQHIGRAKARAKSGVGKRGNAE